MDKAIEDFLDDFEIKLSVERRCGEPFLNIIDNPNYFDDKNIDRMKSIKLAKKVRDFFYDRIDFDRLKEKDDHVLERAVNDLEDYYGDNWKEKAEKELVKEVREWLSS